MKLGLCSNVIAIYYKNSYYNIVLQYGYHLRIYTDVYNATAVYTGKFKPYSKQITCNNNVIYYCKDYNI